MKNLIYLLYILKKENLNMLKLYNALTKKVSEFVPVNKNLVTMYFCGPTVYWYQHIGNMRAFTFMDELRRVIKYNGYKINGVMNITDVGHMTSDADEGDDKMLVASAREKKSPWQIADYYMNVCLQDMKKLNIDMPEHIIKATDVIKDTIEFVEILLKNGFAYKTSKGIYYDISKYSEYGSLGGMNQDEKLMGARIEVDNVKKNPADFALWVNASKEHIMQWKSPWGMGYPGWHIECSTIGRKILGDNIDIHGGGVEHKTIHHENEIAQNYGIANKHVVKRWIHLEHLMVNGGKMSKSQGTAYTVSQLIEKGYNPLDLKYFFFNAHYSKQQNFTFEALDSAHVALLRMYDLVLSHKNGDTEIDNDILDKYDRDFLNAINDDLNLPLALSVVWELLKSNPKSKSIYDLAVKFDKVLGFRFDELSESADELSEEIDTLAKERWNAKQNKDWLKADELRNKIENLGYVVLDSKDSYTLKKR